MYFFYIDESGSVAPHHEPLKEGETPLFCLNALAIREDKWRHLDRQYLYLKREFFKKEIGTRRAEYYEVKGNYLLAPANRGSRRNAEFLRRTLRLCDRLGAQGFSIAVIKNPDTPSTSRTLYSLALQYLVERLHLFLDDCSDDPKGILIIDSRSRELDANVARSHLSFVFGHATGRGYHRILEAPLFADSKLTVGLQVADIIGSCIYANGMHRRCSTVPGVPDYSHSSAYWALLNTIQFKGPPSRSGLVTYGYRIIDWKTSPPPHPPDRP
jgi:hypothetical protein